MLTELYIENLAVIEKATIALCDSLNIFTGETGAGKSILIGGINAVLGQRVYKDIIRTGKDRALVIAVFTDVPKNVLDKLDELGLGCEDGQLIISREINIDGKSSAKINQRPVNISTLREIGDLLVNIHGQHDSQVLLDPCKHIDILDGYASSDELISDYRSSFKELQAVAKEISREKIKAQQKEERQTYLSRVIEDIGSLNITSPDEEDQIEERFRLAENSVALSDAISSALYCISGKDEDEGAGGLIAKAYSELKLNEEFLKELRPLSERLSSAGIEIGDVANELSRLLSSIDIDESEFESLSNRRNKLASVKRRYGPTLSDAIRLYESCLEEYAQLESSEELLQALRDKKDKLLLETTKKAEALSKYRIDAAQRFCDEVGSELSFLNMPDVKIVVDIQKGKLTQNGMDNVEFLISTNKGESPKPLAKIASGGELSRIMLALKSVLADKDKIPTLIFDEIDSGVSGRAAQKIGIKLKELSRKHQVICITHLPQIAITADNHLLIEKTSRDGRTATEIRQLSFDERVYEIARILGGDNITPTVLKDAEEQLKSVMNLNMKGK